MNQHDQMQQLRETLREIQISAEDCANGNYPWPHKQNYSDIAEHARRALAHVNETPKNEHGSDDVLKRAPLVRLTDEEIWLDDGIMSVNADLGLTFDQIRKLTHAIMDAMIAANK